MFQAPQRAAGARPATRLAGFYASDDDAQDAMRGLLSGSGLVGTQLRLLGPTDGAAVVDRAVLPRGHSPWSDVIRSPMAMGLLGLVAGVVSGATLLVVGNLALRAAPLPGLSLLAALGGVLGLVAAGVAALRPDHTKVIEAVHEGLQDGRWVVVVHPRSEAQALRALPALSRGSVRVMRSQ